MNQAKSPLDSLQILQPIDSDFLNTRLKLGNNGRIFRVEELGANASAVIKALRARMIDGVLGDYAGIKIMSTHAHTNAPLEDFRRDPKNLVWRSDGLMSPYQNAAVAFQEINALANSDHNTPLGSDHAFVQIQETYMQSARGDHPDRNLLDREKMIIPSVEVSTPEGHIIIYVRDINAYLTSFEREGLTSSGGNPWFSRVLKRLNPGTPTMEIIRRINEDFKDQIGLSIAHPFLPTSLDKGGERTKLCGIAHSQGKDFLEKAFAAKQGPAALLEFNGSQRLPFLDARTNGPARDFAYRHKIIARTFAPDNHGWRPNVASIVATDPNAGYEEQYTQMVQALENGEAVHIGTSLWSYLRDIPKIARFGLGSLYHPSGDEFLVEQTIHEEAPLSYAAFLAGMTPEQREGFEKSERLRQKHSRALAAQYFRGKMKETLPPDFLERNDGR